MSDPLLNHGVLNDQTVNDLTEYASLFSNADPFKHVLIKDFLDARFLDQILTEFPIPQVGQLINEFGGKSKKHSVHNIRNLGTTFCQWDDFLKSTEFINYLEKLTDIEGLIYDPEYHGAGTHNNMDGQGMDAHVDFNLHRTTGYHRRLNLIIYLNKEWDENWGGNLEVQKNPWEPEENYSHIFPPFLNNAILFETNEYSWHGFERIKLPQDKKEISRKSLTVYYYSKSRPSNEIAPKHGTIYVQKSLPENIKANTIITEDDYDNLTEIFKHRNGYLQGLYTRESQLSVKIQGLEHRLKQYQDNFRLNTIGDVSQEQSATGMLPNGKVESNTEMIFKAISKITKVSIHVIIPNFLEKNSIRLTVNGKAFEFLELLSGPNELSFEINSDPGENIAMSLTCDTNSSAFEQKISNDKQKIGFIVNYLRFL